MKPNEHPSLAIKLQAAYIHAIYIAATQSKFYFLFYNPRSKEWSGRPTVSRNYSNDETAS